MNGGRWVCGYGMVVSYARGTTVTAVVRMVCWVVVGRDGVIPVSGGSGAHEYRKNKDSAVSVPRRLQADRYYKRCPFGLIC